MRSHCRLRRLVVTLLFALIAVAALAQSIVYKPGSPLMMWKVCSKTNCAYVLGSVHLGDQSLYPLPSVIENAFTSSSVLIVEVDVNKVDKQKLQDLTLSAGSYPSGDGLFKHITPDTRAKLDAFLGRYGIPTTAVAQYRPWMVGLMVETLPAIIKGFNANDGLDMHFLSNAGNKRVEQLEDAAWQVKLLSEFPDSESDKTILRSITQAESANETMKKFETLWSQGATAKMEDLIASLSADESTTEKSFDRRLREDRNPHMAARLEKCLQSSAESCFMVVGAAHVIGSEGILSLIEARGYKVEQAVVEGQPSR